MQNNTEHSPHELTEEQQDVLAEQAEAAGEEAEGLKALAKLIEISDNVEIAPKEDDE